MKSAFLTAAILFAAIPAPAALAQAPAMESAAMRTMTLRQGTPVILALQQTLSSKTTKVGERFNLTTSEPVKVNGVTVIPVGTPGFGEVTKVVKKGAFGKSGKLETRLLYVKLGEENIGLTGNANDAGEGGTGATVAVAVIAGVFSAFVTGTSAELPVGATMTGFVSSDTPMLAAAAPAPIMIPAAAPPPVPAVATSPAG